MKVSIPDKYYHQIGLTGNKVKTRFCYQWGNKEIRCRKIILLCAVLPETLYFLTYSSLKWETFNYPPMVKNLIINTLSHE